MVGAGPARVTGSAGISHFQLQWQVSTHVQYNKRGLTYHVAAGDQVFVYGKPSPDNGAIAIFTLDDMAPESVNTANAHQVGSDLPVLWSSGVLAKGNHELNVTYDPQSRKDGKFRYLFLSYFSYNEPSEYILTLNKPLHVLSCIASVFSLNSTSSSTPPTPIIETPKFMPVDPGVTWNTYVAPAPILGAVLGTVIVLLLFGTTIFLCKHRRRRLQDEFAPDPFINRGSSRGLSPHRFLTSFADRFSDLTTDDIHLSTKQTHSDPSQQYLRSRPYVEPVQTHRDFPPPPRPPPTVTSINYGDHIAETLSTVSLNERESSIHEPRGYRLRIPGSSYQRPSDTTFHHVSSILFSCFIPYEESMS